MKPIEINAASLLVVVTIFIFFNIGLFREIIMCKFIAPRLNSYHGPQIIPLIFDHQYISRPIRSTYSNAIELCLNKMTKNTPVQYRNLTNKKFRAIRALASFLSVAVAASTTVAQADEPPIRPVNSITIEARTDGVKRTFFGRISAKQTVDLGFQVSGRLIELNAREGSVISKGTVIAKLDPIPFEINVERARLTVEQAERAANRFEKLVGNSVSKAQLLDAKTELQLAKIDSRNAAFALEKSTITAPFDAIVASRSIGNYSTVGPGTQVVRLHDLSEMRVDIEVPEMLIQRLGENPDVLLSARFPGSDKTYPLEFREVKAEISELGQTFRVTLAMKAPTDRLLLPGASVVVEALLNDEVAGVVVPPSAIATDAHGNTSILRLIEGDNGPNIERVPVSMHVASSGNIEILAGISPGDEIILGGVNDLEDGQAVRRFNTDYK